MCFLSEFLRMVLGVCSLGYGARVRLLSCEGWKEEMALNGVKEVGSLHGKRLGVAWKLPTSLTPFKAISSFHPSHESNLTRAP